MDVHPAVARLAAWSWRLLVIGLAAAAGLWLLGRLLVVVVPVAAAVLLVRALAPVAGWLRRHRWRPAPAAVATMGGFLLLMAAVIGTAGFGVANGFDELGPTLRTGVDDLETWLVDDSPFDVDDADVRRWRAAAGDAVARFASTSSDSIVRGAVVAVEALVGLVLTVIVTFFLLKDGPRMVDGVLRRVPASRRTRTRRVGERAWEALGGYLRGAALLGVVEALAMGLTLLLVGGDLVVPVMLITFLAAFVPIVGATAAAVVAVLVALVTAGGTGALVVMGVALVVQQLDNDLLAPVIYGRAARLPPLGILLGIAAGGALFGVIGSVLAVPVLAVVINVADEARNPTGAAEPEPSSSP